MSVPLELLYRLRNIDDLSSLWGPRFFNSNALTNQVGPSVGHITFSPEQDRVCFVTAVWGFMFMSGPSQVREFHPMIYAAPRLAGGATGGEVHRLGHEVFPLGARAPGEDVSFFREVDFCIVGQVHFLTMDFLTFAPGDLNNVFQWGFQGYEVAKGNVVLR